MNEPVIVKIVELLLHAAVQTAASQPTIEQFADKAPAEDPLLPAEGMLKHPINSDALSVPLVGGIDDGIEFLPVYGAQQIERG